MTNFVGVNLKMKIKEYFRKESEKHYLIKGVDNKILLKNPKTMKRFHIEIYGNGNIVDVRTKEYFVATIYIGTSDCPVENCRVIIEDGATAGGVMMRILENNSEVTIGQEALFSYNIEMYCSDTHSIFNEQGELINYGKFINIGPQVWVGAGVSICKNTEIAAGCVVGTKAVVSGKFAEQNCVLAGNPARVVKQNIKWSRERPNIVAEQIQRGKK